MHYTVSYNNNVNVGTATVIITGKGNYTGTATKTFTIEKGNIKLNITGTTYTYDGAEHTINVVSETPSSGITVTYGVEQGKYTLKSSPKYIEVGTYDIYYKVTAGNNYNELEGMQKLTIEPIEISKLTASPEPNEYIYDETEKTPNLIIKNGNYTLQKETDYTITYNNNINAGEATIIAAGKGHYKGTLENKFTIKPQDLSNGIANLTEEKIIYNKKEQTPEVEVRNSSNKILEKEKDYTVSYSNNTNSGTATFTITGTNNYTGKITKEFTIEKANIEYSSDDIELIYDGKPHGISIEFITEMPKTDIKFGTSETECNLDTMPTYTDAGNYKIYYAVSADNYNNIEGYVELVIKPKEIATATISEISENCIYDTMEKEPTIEVKDEIQTLILNKDYKVTYQNNTNVGTASVIVTGIGNYTGTNKADFKIEKADPTYILPSGIVTYYGAKLENVKLPKGFVWEDDLNTSVGEIRI